MKLTMIDKSFKSIIIFFLVVMIEILFLVVLATITSMVMLEMIFSGVIMAEKPNQSMMA